MVGNLARRLNPLNSLRAILIDFRGLPLSVQLLATLGYLAVLGLLLATLFFEWLGSQLNFVEYSAPAGLYHIPFTVVVITSLTFVLGWAFVLAGAAGSKARVFLPVLALFAFQLFILTGALGDWVLLAMCAEGLFLAALLGLYAFTFRKRFWRDYPLPLFIFWLGVAFFFIGLMWVLGQTDEAVTNQLAGTLNVLALLTLIFWVRLGLDAVELAVKVGRAVTVGLRRRLPEAALTALTILILLVRPALGALAIALTKDGFWGLDLLASGALIVWGAGLALTRRWSARASATLLALGLVSPVFALAVSLAFQGHDFTDLIVSAIGLFPPVLLFVALTTYNMIGFGVSFANVEGAAMPRRARVLLYFGMVILVTTFVLFFMNQRDAVTGEPDQSTQSLINNLFALSALALGLPYLGWMVWRRREDLIGADDEFAGEPRWAWLARVSSRVWLMLGAGVGLLCACPLCALSIWALALAGR